MAKKKDFVTDWATSIRDMKMKVNRVFKKDDVNREVSYIFDGWSRDYLTGDKLISLHTKKHFDNELENYLTIVI